MALLETDLIAVNRGGVDYKATLKNFRENDSDLINICRNNINYKTTINQIPALQDSDFLSICRGDKNYKVTAAELKNYLTP